jgi:dTDP-4-amino-4,6-dideoxygalactose transaminase
MKVPLVDLGRQHREIADEVEHGLSEVIGATAFIHGPQVAAFEAEFAEFCGVGHCIGVGNGTDALELAIRALGLGEGDQVVVPANSFIASALGVIRAGAEVVLVDSDPDTHLIDVSAVARAMGPRVHAVMPVHLFGQTAPVEEIAEIAGDADILEDAAQSQGATRHGKPAGSLGRIAGTSFYPGKNIGAYGDAGAVLTSDDDLADMVRRLGNWGSAEKYHHPVAGFNSRLDTVQAVVLRAKLTRLSRWNEQRSIAAKRYDQLLDGWERVRLPATLEGNIHIWHLYVIRVPERDAVLQELHSLGVGAGVHYPVPMHLQGALSDLGHVPGDFPVAERAAAQILSLPIFPGITESEQEFVVDSLRQVVGRVRIGLDD